MDLSGEGGSFNEGGRERGKGQFRDSSEVKVTGWQTDWMWGIRERKKSRTAAQIGFKNFGVNATY